VPKQSQVFNQNYKGASHLHRWTSHSENFIKSPLLYIVSYFNVEGLSPPMLPVATGLI